MDKLIEIGMPVIGLQDKLIFYDLLHAFFEASTKFVNLLHREKSDYASKQKLMDIISLSNISDSSPEELDDVEELKRLTVEENEVKEPAVDKKALKHVYAGMISNGEIKEAYDLLIKNGVYLPLKMVEKEGGELNQYRERFSKLEDFPLYKHLDNMITGYYEKEIKSDDSITKVVYKLRIDEYVRMDITFEYNANKQEFLLVGSAYGLRFSSSMWRFKECEKFVERLKRKYKELQNAYGEALIPDMLCTSGFSETVDEKRNVSTISITGLAIISDEIAEIIAEFMIRIAQNKSLMRNPELYSSVHKIKLGEEYFKQ